MKRYRISVGSSRLSARIERKTSSWQKIVKRLLQYDALDVSYAEYLALGREKQANLKDVGFYIGGQFNGAVRKAVNLKFRSLITLDVDHIDSWDLEEIQNTYSQYEYVVHSTLKHSPETPRLRLVFPLQKEIPVDQYEPLARTLADMIGLDVFDDTTFEATRIFYWPAVCSDGVVFKHHNVGKFISADEWLAKYHDWQDFAEWPHSTRVTAIRPAGRQAEDPLTKKGIIGAFNRTFDIHAAIERFELPYEQTEHDNRYRPIDATGPSGAVVYDDIFLYSHHESDAVGQQNVNAWDLVRIHKFGSSDVASDNTEVPIMQWPSSKLMAALAGAIPEVQKELRVNPAELENVGTGAGEGAAGDSGGIGSGESTPANTDLTFDSLMDEIAEINPLSKNLLTVAKSMIPRIAAAKLDPQDVDVLAGALRDLYPKPKPSKAALVSGIKVSGRRLTGVLADSDGSIVDIEQDLIEAMLKDHYDAGRTLKRIGRKFWTYEDGLWAIHDDEAIKGKMIKTLTQLRVKRPDDMLSLVAAVGETKTSALSSSLFSMMTAELAEREQRDDPLGLMRSYPLPIINCRNCELYLDAEGKVEVRDHNPDHFYTLRIDTKYDSAAVCPEWDRFMQMIFSNSSDCEDVVRHLEELGGYVIQFSRWLKTWVLFHGNKDTGKSTVAEVIKALLGTAFIGMEMSAFGRGKSDFADSNLIGKLALVDDDYDKSSALPDGFIKKISEEKSMTSNIKYGDPVQFVSRSLPMVLSNHWPISRDVSDAFRERALVFPFANKICGANRSDVRRAKMMLELPGILNRFIAGLVRLRKRGNWDIPLDCFDAHSTWEIKSNPARLFVFECLNVHAGSSEFIKASRLWEAYRSWGREQRSSDASMRGLSKAELFERMDSILGDRVRRNGYAGWAGLTWTTDMLQELEDLDSF